MSFTNLALVKAHLLSSDYGAYDVENVRVTLNGTAQTELPHHNLVNESDVVKWDTSVYPDVEEGLVLTGDEWSKPVGRPFVRGSVVIALSSSLATIYSEESDYKVDYAQGCVRRVAGSTIPESMPLLMYYYAYHVFERDADYDLDPACGTLRRTSDSSIPDGAAVLVDYQVTAGSVTDELILQAITEAEDCIVRLLGPGFTPDSTDQGLKTGATELVLSIIARDMAGEALARRLLTDSGARAKQWQDLSQLYERQAWLTLRPFLEPYGLRSPEKRTNE
jgi:hypothetical protein